MVSSVRQKDRDRNRTKESTRNVNKEGYKKESIKVNNISTGWK